MPLTNVLTKCLIKGESPQLGISRWAALGLILSMTACTSSTATSGPGNCAEARSTSDVVFCQDFDGSALGDWDLNDLKNDFPGTRGYISGPTGAPSGKAGSRATIVSGGDAVSGNSLRAQFPKDRIGAGTGAQFKAPIGANLNEAYIGYWVRFEPSFPDIKGGKLPGLTGGTTDEGETPCCGRPMKKGLGFSTRLMFVGGRKVVNYFYWIDNPRLPRPGTKTINGDGKGAAYMYQPGQWYFIEEHVKLNTPAGANNGLFEVWINGAKTTTIANTRIRGPGASFSISHILFNTYLGGGDSSWCSPKDTYNFFDVMVVSRNRIVRTDQPFRILSDPTFVPQQGAVPPAKPLKSKSLLNRTQ